MLQVTKADVEDEIKRRLPEEVENFFAEDPLGGESVILVEEDSILSLSLRRMDKLIWVMGVSGKGVKWIWKFQKWALENGFEQFGFKVAKDLPWGKSLARFSKAALIASTESDDEYVASLRAR